MLLTDTEEHWRMLSFRSTAANAHFDDDEFWTVGKSRGTNLFQVAAHEFGHSLGLSHSNVKSSLMAPFYRGYQRHFSLHKDDISAIQALYGKKEKKPKKPSIETPEEDPDKEDDIDNTIGQADGDAPDLCHDSTIDAVVKTKNMFSYVFKGDYYWRVVDEGLADGYPRKISADWDNLPGNIDAAFTWRDGRTFFFKGGNYWRFTNKQMHLGYPKKIKVGFEGIPDNVDAAFVHSKNKKTYVFKGNEYWRFDSKAAQPVADMYPRPISSWEGLPDTVDAAFEWNNGKDYFFQGSRYYRLKKGTFTVDKNYPRSTSIWWFGCKADSETKSSSLRIHPELGTSEPKGNGNTDDDFEIEVRLDHDEDDDEAEDEYEHPVIRSAGDSLDTSVVELDQFERADIAPDDLEKEKLTDKKKNNAKSIHGTIILVITFLISLLLVK
ncbi:Matrix metalloproteinase-19 [Nymphon striatum]|nr:Matrix metalloproteinase-19 [Nymphon striatum]